MEYGEKMLKSCEIQLDRADKQLKQKESEPKREWFQSRNERLQEKDKLRLDSYNGKKKKLSKEEREKMPKAKTVTNTLFLILKGNIKYLSVFSLSRQMIESSLKCKKSHNIKHVNLKVNDHVIHLHFKQI